MWSNLLSAALLYGVLSTTVVVAQTTSFNPALPANSISSTPSPTDFLGPSSTVTQVSSARGPGSGTTNVHGADNSDLANGQAKDAQSSADVPRGSATPNEGPNRSSTPMASSVSKNNKNNTGAIAGGVVGGVLFLVLVGALVFFLRRRKRTRDPFGSIEKSADETVANYESPSPLPPAPIVDTSASPHPHHSPATPNEAHALMSHYGDTQPQHMPQEVQPVIMPAKPYNVNSSSREIRDEDDDGISINSPSPVTTPSPERQQEQQRSVPRLPIYQGGRKDDVGGNSPPPAL